MSKILFSVSEQEILIKNIYVKKVSDKAITYTDEFKDYAVKQNASGKSAVLIFKESGFDLKVIGRNRIRNSLARWKKAFAIYGEEGLKDTRATNSGRPLEKTLTSDEIILRKDAEIEYLKRELELVKKFERLEGRRWKEGRENNELLTCAKYELIRDVYQKYDKKVPLNYLCHLAYVSRSGYYNYFSERSFSRRKLKDSKDNKDIEIIKEIADYRGFKKGSRTIKMLLETKKGIVWSRRKIQRLMNKYGIKCKIRKANPYKRMAKAIKENNYAPNLLKRNFTPGEAHKVLLTDITYIYYGKNRKLAYLSAIKDSQTKEILAYNISESLKMDLVTVTLEKLMSRTEFEVKEGTMMHSDQGCHYTSHKYINLLDEHKITRSMSRRGNCWDNAPIESFFGLMKQETDFKHINSYEELEKYMDEYMCYYNNERPQWNMEKTTPVDYRNCLLGVA